MPTLRLPTSLLSHLRTDPEDWLYGWVNDRFDNRTSTAVEVDAEKAAELSFEARAQRKWDDLVEGFENDVQEYRSRDGSADFDKPTGTECRISSTASRIAVIVTIDFSAHTVHYVYEPGDLDVAVPEEGVFTLRPAANSVEIYSADERLSSDAARRMVLEPLLFPLPNLKIPAPTSPARNGSR